MDAAGNTGSAANRTFTVDTNAAPTASTQSVATDEDTPKTITLSGSDPDGGNLTFEVTDDPTKGTLGSIGPASCTGMAPKNCQTDVTYTPDSNYSGNDSFEFRVNDGTVNSTDATVSITVNPVNHRPVANKDEANTTGNTAVNIPVLTNDTDADGDTLTVTKVSKPKNGTAKINANTTVTYKPNANFNGKDSFTYNISDGEGGTDTATVTVTVRDTTRPTVIGINMTGDSAKPEFTVTFSEAMNKSTINKNTFMLVDRDTKKSIAATIRYDATNKKAVLKPKRNLHSGTTYVLTVKGGASGVKDLAGNALAGNKVWTFTG